MCEELSIYLNDNILHLMDIVNCNDYDLRNYSEKYREQRSPKHLLYNICCGITNNINKKLEKSFFTYLDIVFINQHTIRNQIKVIQKLLLLYKINKCENIVFRTLNERFTDNIIGAHLYYLAVKKLN